MIIDLKRSIDLRLLLISGAIFISDDLLLFFATLPLILSDRQLHPALSFAPSWCSAFLRFSQVSSALKTSLSRLVLLWLCSASTFCLFWFGLMNLSRKLQVSIYGVFKIPRLAQTTLLHKSWAAICPLATRSSLSLAHHWTIGNHYKLYKGQQKIVIFVTDSVLWSQSQSLCCFGQDADALIVPLSLFTCRHFIC